MQSPGSSRPRRNKEQDLVPEGSSWVCTSCTANSACKFAEDTICCGEGCGARISETRYGSQSLGTSDRGHFHTYTHACIHSSEHRGEESERSREWRETPTPTNKHEHTGDKAAARSKNVDRDVPTSCRHLQHTTSILLDSMLLHPVAVEKLKILALHLERCKRAATPYMLSVSEPLPNCDKTSQLTDVEDWFFARDRSSNCCACSWACMKSTINPLTYPPYLSQTALSTEACAFATTFSEQA
jgi:hypothetical protein